MTAPDDDRRSFQSRTPANDHPAQVTYRRGFVTRHQVTGWRFMRRRIASGVALHDTRMLVDPLRTQSRAVLVGALILVTGIIGCFLFSLIRPGGAAGTDSILADRETAALYVKLGDQLHPVLNLTSARLITGRPDNPSLVKSAELDQFARGNTLGIPGAPERMVPDPTADAHWTVCDAQTGAITGVTVITGEPAGGGEKAEPLPDGEALFVENAGRTWLLWEGKRSPIDITDRAVIDGLGLGGAPLSVQPIATGVFNAIPEAPALTAPAIPGAGAPPALPLPVAAPIGAVVVAYEADNTLRHYVVLADGLQPISPVVASILRNTDSFGLDQPPRLGADTVAQLPTARGVDTAAYPAGPVTLVDTATDPVICASWAKPEGAQAESLTLLSGAALPIADGVQTVDLVTSGAPGGPADRVAMPAGTGYFVDSGSGLFWLSDTGVRYGIDTASTDGTDTLEALGLSAAPLPAPWSVLSQFATGPTLSRTDALLAHDTLAPNPSPARLQTAPRLENP
ncbi:type VII secretion protein EccB [Mycolicibacterium duvalii]|uniref:ESX-3 secretion system ATPase EccB3 n=1 Tax=Mycolicibacterium duvalii TaxID=39688 RepID=A0A7I7K6A2_9MYCO|nr:type VII secretion protein EccB [Mycolicibacterium duvalii]MCV7368996.1 type VII secretion protein EccB [Mycolicibacterium duvalii]PEG44473.1 type VII secretion protein EccB [Mycolicibacterium duvalii]BBX19104.1 ESX-3 secretion system ATPase EccB3 [Mycolicibacterium duvalii]